jgi:hypothetical protein
MITASNDIYAHAQDYAMNDDFQLSAWKHSHNVIPNTRYSKCLTFVVCVVAEQSVAPTNSNTVVPTVASRTRAAPDTPVLHRWSSGGLWSLDANMYARFEDKRELMLVSDFGGLVVSMLASGTQDRGFKPVGFFRA